MALIKCPECGRNFSDQADACPDCGYPIRKIKPNKKKKGHATMIMGIIIAVVIVILIGVLVSVVFMANQKRGDESIGETLEAIANSKNEKVYLSDDQIQEFFTSPEKFKGYYIKLGGQVFVDPEVDGNTTALQIYADPENATQNFIVHYSGNESFAMNDFVIVDGKINGIFTGENMFGATLEVPLIKSESIEKTTYAEAVVPAESEIDLQNASTEQQGITISITRAEFAESETRLYVKISNNSSANFSPGAYSAKVIQNNGQIDLNIESMTTYYDNLPELSDTILPGMESEGVLVFNHIDIAPFQLQIEGYSDDWNIALEPFVIDVAIQATTPTPATAE